MPYIVLRLSPFQGAIKPISQNSMVFHAVRKGENDVSLKNIPAETARFVAIRFLFREKILSKSFTVGIA